MAALVQPEPSPSPELLFRQCRADQIFEGEVKNQLEKVIVCGHVGQHGPTSNSVKGILRLRAACFLYVSQIFAVLYCTGAMLMSRRHKNSC